MVDESGQIFQLLIAIDRAKVIRLPDSWAATKCCNPFADNTFCMVDLALVQDCKRRTFKRKFRQRFLLASNRESAARVRQHARNWSLVSGASYEIGYTNLAFRFSRIALISMLSRHHGRWPCTRGRHCLTRHDMTIAIYLISALNCERFADRSR